MILFLLIGKRFRNIKAIVLILLIYIAFFFYINAYNHFQQTNLSEDSTHLLIGKITSIPVIDGDRMRFRFAVQGDEAVLVQHKISSLQEKDSLKHLYIGDECRLHGELQKPSGKRNFYAFDYEQYLKQTFQIHWIYETRQNARWVCKKSSGILNNIRKYRQASMEKIKNDFRPEIAPIMNTLIFGDRTELDDDLKRRYQSLGLIHLLAISGLHVGTLLGMMYFLMIRFGMVREHALVALLILIPCIILFTGGAPSVIRAGLMAAFVCLTILFQLKIPVHTQLSLIALLLLLYKPTYIFHIGFQLSFLITASLIVSNTFLLKEKSPFIQLLLGSAIAQIASLPIILWNFHEFSLWSLPLNIVYIPLMTLYLLPLVLFTYFLYLVVPFPIWELPAEVIAICFTWIHKVMEVVDAWEIGKMTIGKPSFLLMFLFVVSLIVVLLWIEKRQTLKAFFYASVLIVTVFSVMLHHHKLDPNAYVTFLDVGQGDAIVVELPYRRAVYVIDTGGQMAFQKEDWMKRKKNFDTGEDIVVPFLKARGIKRIDKLFLTHGDYDHIGGTKGLIKHMDVERVIYGEVLGISDGEQRLLQEMASNSIKISSVNRSLQWSESKSHFRLIAAEGFRHEKNNRSMVLYMSVYDQTFLFTGDIEKDRERELIAAFPRLKADFLKAAHHGSDTSSSSEFLDQINPKTVFISAGAQNRYGHPSSEVVGRYVERGVSVYENAEYGGVMVIIEPGGIKIETTR
ncbi:DNA internalization-related competence protein ComEC/Rec2 [Pseudalkalibacillus sp. Hm43]